MKKHLILLASFLFLLSLTGCVTADKGYRLAQVCGDVQSVEIYKAEKRYYEGDIHDFREENEPILTIPAEDCADFLVDLENLEFEEDVVLFPIPMDGGYDYTGYILIVVYANGSYDLIAEEGKYLYRTTSDGSDSADFDHSDYCGEEKWSVFVKRYISDFD